MTLISFRCSEAVLVSASDGFTIDTQPPVIVFTSLGIFGNDTEELIHTAPSLYQQEIDAIALAWNSTDDASGTFNDTWMAGSLPLTADKHDVTMTTDNQIPLLAVTMDHADTVIFTVTSADLAGNIAVASSPPLTIDITPPLIKDFRYFNACDTFSILICLCIIMPLSLKKANVRHYITCTMHFNAMTSGLLRAHMHSCTEYVSMAATEVTCTWSMTLDDESPLRHQQVAIGTQQLMDDVYSFESVPYSQYSWRKSIEVRRCSIEYNVI